MDRVVRVSHRWIGLQELEQEGIVERAVIPDTPVRVEYALTKKGRALTSAVDAIMEWAHKWIDPEEAASRTSRRRGRVIRKRGARIARDLSQQPEADRMGRPRA